MGFTYCRSVIAASMPGRSAAGSTTPETAAAVSHRRRVSCSSVRRGNSISVWGKAAGVDRIRSVIHLVVAGFVGMLIVRTVGDVDALFGTARFGLQSRGVILLVG